MSQAQATVRAFIAIELPVGAKALISTVQGELQEELGASADAVRWVKAESIHLTLLFLGDTPLAQIDAIVSAMERACSGISPFSLNVTGLGVFPNMRRPRVLWVGLEGEEQQARNSLRALSSAIGEQMLPLGFTADKSFRPHLTIGRVREGASRQVLTEIGNTLTYPETQPRFETTVRVHSISLMRSDLQPGGSVYTRLAEVPLDSNNQGA